MGFCCSKYPKDIYNNETIDLRHFRLLRTIGKGSFGKVRIVQQKNTKELFALKYISKDLCIYKDAVDNVLRERDYLELLQSHPFLVNLKYAFQDDVFVYMVQDLMLGGDLRYHLKKGLEKVTRVSKYKHILSSGDTDFVLPWHWRGPLLDEKLIRFWMAELSLAIYYIHKKGIIHRDLKPENLLIDLQGHIHIADFNVAVLVPPKGKYIKSLSGTASYMAPEIVTKIGYREEVDWWSLGVIMYECMFGKKPFRGRTKEEIYSLIAKGRYKWRTKYYSEDCLSFLKTLLQRNPIKRMGHNDECFLDVKTHPFFNGMDWKGLEALELECPFKPDSTKINFEPKYELEEVLETDTADKLKYRPRSHFSRFSSITPGIPSTTTLVKIESDSDLLYWSNLPPGMKRFELEYKDYNYQNLEALSSFETLSSLTKLNNDSIYTPANGTETRLLLAQEGSKSEEEMDTNMRSEIHSETKVELNSTMNKTRRLSEI